MARKRVPDDEITKEMLLEVLDYRDGMLFWKKSLAHWVKPGTPAGGFRRDGYHSIGLWGKPRLSHRIIWKMFHGEVPDLIDHIDRNPSNNRIENLRASDKVKNSYNSGLPRNNKTGFRGVSRAGATWVAAAWVDGKYLRRGFKTCEEAVACREQMINEGGQGNG